MKLVKTINFWLYVVVSGLVLDDIDPNETESTIVSDYWADHPNATGFADPRRLAPDAGDKSCTFGVMCVIQLTGTGLAMTDKVRIILSDDTCGSGEAITTITNPIPVPAPWTSETTPITLVPYVMYVMGTPTYGGGRTYDLCWGANPSVTADFSTTVGVFTVNGPANADTNCFLTEECRLTLGGLGFAATNKLRLY